MVLHGGEIKHCSLLVIICKSFFHLVRCIESVCLAGSTEEDKGEVVNNEAVVVVVVEEVVPVVVVVVAGVLVRVLQRKYLLKILMRILISTILEIWRQTKECDRSSQTARGF